MALDLLVALQTVHEHCFGFELAVVVKIVVGVTVIFPDVIAKILVVVEHVAANLAQIFTSGKPRQLTLFRHCHEILRIVDFRGTSKS